MLGPILLLAAADFAALDAAIEKAVQRGQPPGAVVLVLHRDRVVHRKAFGLRSKLPAEVPMTLDTVFDVASLTKPVATAASVLLLIERGKLKLADPAAKHWPAFGQQGKERITVEQFLLHTAGLIADNPLADYTEGRAKALENICRLKPLAEPGKRFVYSDVNHIVLGEIVERVSGTSLDRFARDNLFAPLGMKDTGFLPGAELRKRAAPTEKRDGAWLVGEVHDPRCHRLGGVAGHAGLFSTADDLAVFVRMLLKGGTHDGKRILAAETVRLFTEAVSVPGGKRARGWDVDTAFSSPRGSVFPRGVSFGHTGFTGTSIWVDPKSQTAALLLTSRLHPDGKGDVRQLRRDVATLAAEPLLPR